MANVLTRCIDHPLQTATLVCFLSGISLLILNRFVHRIPAISRPDKYSTIPLTELDDSTVEVLSPVSNDDDSAKDKRTWKWWLGIGLVTGIGCARLSLYRNITENVECAPPGYAVSSSAGGIKLSLNLKTRKVTIYSL